MLRLDIKNNMQIGTLEGTDRLNAPVATVVKEALNSMLEQNHYTLVLNLENIRFIDSTGIGVLISALKTARQNDGMFMLSNVNKEVMGLLSLMKLDKVFDFSS